MKKIIEALNNYELSEISPINLLRESSDNQVFIIGNKNKKILRVSKRLSIEDVNFEYEAIEYLFDNGIVVPKWLTTKTGDFYVLVDNKVAVLFDFLNGHYVEVDKDHLPTPVQVYNAGRGLGLMSNIAPSFTSTSPRKRNIFSELERAIDLSHVFIDQFEGGKEFIDQVREAIKFGKNQKEIEGLIHNDYRPSNVLFGGDDELAGIIDFDWSCIGPVIKDLALAVAEWSFPGGAIEPDFKIFDSFIEGYNSMANYKVAKDERLYSWIKFTTLSDASTYLCDLIGNPNENKKIMRSYMYQKYLYFKSHTPTDKIK